MEKEPQPDELAVLLKEGISALSRGDYEDVEVDRLETFFDDL